MKTLLLIIIALTTVPCGDTSGYVDPSAAALPTASPTTAAAIDVAKLIADQKSWDFVEDAIKHEGFGPSTVDNPYCFSWSLNLLIV